jgi:RNA polymerase sigma factor (sigma-70 family)
MKGGAPRQPLTQGQRDLILAARQAAARTALRVGAGNTVGLTHDELRALAEDGLLAALAEFDEEKGDFGTFSSWHVRGAVLHAIRARQRLRRREAPMDAALEHRRARDRAGLDALGAGMDADAFDLFDDTEEDFLRQAQDAADEGMLVLVLGRLARGTGAAEKLLLRRELLERLDAEIERLPPAPARLVRLYFYEGQTGEEIAELTGMPRSTVYQQISVTVALLRLRLKERGGQG